MILLQIESERPMHSFWRCIAILSLYTVHVLVTMSLFWVFWVVVRLALKLPKCKGSKVFLSIVLGLVLTCWFIFIGTTTEWLLQVGIGAEDLVSFVPFINFPCCFSTYVCTKLILVRAGDISYVTPKIWP